MNKYIPISMLNDFFFCPYSIYLHNLYLETDEGLYQAESQVRGKIAHKSIDYQTARISKGDMVGLSVYSDTYNLMGKIDMYRHNEDLHIERKYQLKRIYKGQIYQLWAQYLCLSEMGYDVKQLAFYEIAKNKTFHIPIPNDADIEQLTSFLKTFRSYNPSMPMVVNPNN